ncbi:MAG: MFS transporter [Planctomycetes bacterium]|nr:MFS transporter [Planctomycetota bacterium]
MSRTALPPPRSGLTKHQTRSALGAFYVNASLRAVYDVICAPTSLAFTTFALALGVPGDRMGIFSSLLYAASILQVLAIALNKSVRDKKSFVLALMLAESVIMIAAVLLLPFLPQGYHLPVLAVAAFLSAGSLHLSKPVLDDWVASTVPAPLRGRFLGRKTQLLSTVSMFTTLTVGFIAEALSRPGHTSVIGLGAVLAVGGVFGFLASIPMRSAMIPQTAAEAQADWSDMPGVFRHRPFRRFLVGIVIAALPFIFSIHYYQVYYIEVLHLDKRVIAYISVMAVVIRIILVPLIGRRLVRWGPRRTLRMATVMYVVFFALFTSTAVGGWWLMIPAWVFGAVGDALWVVAQASGVYAAVPHNNRRPAYFAVFNLVALGIYAVGGWLAVLIIEALKDVRLNLGAFELGQYPIFYLGCTLLMIPCVLGPSLMMGRREMRAYNAAEAAETGEAGEE